MLLLENGLGKGGEQERDHRHRDLLESYEIISEENDANLKWSFGKDMNKSEIDFRGYANRTCW